MPNKKTLTVVARSRTDHRPADDLSWPSGDGQIDDMLKLLFKRTQPNDHVVLRACSVGELGDHLTNLGAFKPDLIQIVGHGVPGRLRLTIGSQDESSGGESYVLSSDQSSFETMMSIMHPASEVLLLGCSVGDERKLDAFGYRGLHDGPALLFALSRMWGCTVAAPVDGTSSDDHDDEGVYKATSRSRLTTASALDESPVGTDQPAYIVSRGRAAPVSTVPTMLRVTLTRLVSRSLMGLDRAIAVLQSSYRRFHETWRSKTSGSRFGSPGRVSLRSFTAISI